MTTTGGTPVSFAALYEAHASDVHRFALFLSGDAALADDLVSETFIRVWHARARLELTTVKGYLLAICRNLFVQERRRLARAATLEDTVSDPAPGPHQRAGARDELRKVLSNLQALPEIDRAAVLMRADGGMSYADIGAVLGLSEAAARVRVYRARVALAATRPGRPEPANPKESNR